VYEHPGLLATKQLGRYKQKLFSANVRGYLGSKRSQSNINNGIRETLLRSPSRFWAYNNGITVLVHDFSRTNWFILATGLAVVNGAQTTGAIGSLPTNAEGRILARFIKCEDATTVQDIIRYNNRQNPTEASDFRSNDRVQTRLVQEFRQLRIVGYNGGRRGGADDVIRRRGENQPAATTAAQALAAFHGRPDVAYHEKGQIWEVDAIYSDVFPDRVSARHILFAYRLLRTIEEEKFRLKWESHPLSGHGMIVNCCIGWPP
jgi:AIPR protein